MTWYESTGVPGGRHPGWPATIGPLRVPAGLVAIRPIRLTDGAAWSRIRLRDHNHLQPWEPTGHGSWDERHGMFAWPGLCWALRGMARRGVALPFAITVDDQFCGQVSISNVVRGALLSAWVGYWVASDFTGGGVATVAVALGADHCFGPVGLHRLEATVRPENLASRRVLEKLGFRQEGLYLRYLSVAGAWRDHLGYALTAEEAKEGLVARLLHQGLAERA
jgi:[ribosomal protein S5]-alanine N-acetyltransferase